MRDINRNIIYVLLTVLLLIIGGVFYLYSQKSEKEFSDKMTADIKQYNQQVKAETEQKAADKERADEIKNELGGIACWGSTLTAGNGDSYTYPNMLDELLRKDGYDIPVVNLGVRGENALTTLGRCGAVPYIVKAFTIPSNDNLVEIEVGSQGVGEVMPLTAESNPGINPISIAGVEGVLYGDPDPEDTTRIRHYYFCRTRTGDVVDVQDGTIITTNGKKLYNDYVSVIQLNTEGSVDDMADRYNSFISSLGKNSDKYIILGNLSGDNKSNLSYDNSMVARYGEHYLNIRKYLCSDVGVEASGIVVTEQDKKQIEIGEVPSSMLGDNGNLNRYGYKALSACIYDALSDMSYIKK